MDDDKLSSLPVNKSNVVEVDHDNVDSEEVFGRDSKLEQYLNTLEEYTNVRNEINEQLVKSFITLSKAKLALWPYMISKDSIDLRPRKAQITIDIEVGEDGQKRFIIVKDRTDAQDNESESDREGVLIDSIGETDNSNNNPDASLRQRPPRQHSSTTGQKLSSSDKQQGNKKDDEEGEDDEDDKKEKSGLSPSRGEGELDADINLENAKDIADRSDDPIYRFSTLPPPALRQAQSLFKRCVTQVVECQNVISSLDHQEEVLNSE